MLCAPMNIRNNFFLLVPALLVAQFAACSDPPQPVNVPTAQPKPSTPPGHAELAQGATGDEARLAGTIVFEGAQFDNHQGSVFVSVRVKGTRPPWLARIYPLAEVTFTKNDAGQKTLPFDLRANDPTPHTGTFNSNPGVISPPAGTELELYVCLKPDRDAGSKTLADAVAVFENGKSDYLLKLTLP